MPEYSFICNNCQTLFSIVCSIKDYKDTYKCSCGCKAQRAYFEDLITLNTSIKKSDSELKTLGDLAQRNSDRMSNDEKIHLYKKHNAYKEDTTNLSELPKGMKRLDKKPPKIKWPGTTGIKPKRKPKNGK